MYVCITQNGQLIARSCDMITVPRIGEKLLIAGNAFRVKDVIWHIEHGINTWAEIVVV